MLYFYVIYLAHVLLLDEGVDDLLDWGHELQGADLPLVPVHNVQRLGCLVLNNTVYIVCYLYDIEEVWN